MTTIYIPQRIETPEQAAALPNGTIAIEPDAEADQFSLMRATYDGLDCWITDKKIYTIDFPVGWTALVPTTAVHELACPSCGHTMTATGKTVHANVQRYEHLTCPNCGSHARGTTTLKNPTRTRSAR